MITEHDFQCNIVRTLRMQNIFVFAVPNAQIIMWVVRKLLYIAFKLASIVKIKERQYFSMLLSTLKKQGFLNGVSDLIVLHKGKAYFLEIKKPAGVKISEKTGNQIKVRGGVQSDEQRQFQAEVEKEGFPYLLIDSWKKFEEFLNCLKMQKSIYAMENICSEVTKCQR